MLEITALRTSDDCSKTLVPREVIAERKRFNKLAFVALINPCGRGVTLNHFAVIPNTRNRIDFSVLEYYPKMKLDILSAAGLVL